METRTQLDRRPFPRGIYLVTDESLCTHHPLEKIVESSLLGGVKLVQLREKFLNSEDFKAKAIRLLKLVRSFGAYLIINDRVDLAKEVGADGVHLGQSDLPVNEARKLLGEEVWIGLSVETKEDLKLAKTLPCDSLALSPLFPTKTKTDTALPWGLEGLDFARKTTNKHLTVIGGIKVMDVNPLAKQGADSIAVVSSLCSAENPESIAREMQNNFFKS